MSDPPAVIVVGAGPTGLTLAAELAAAGVACRVLERRPERVPWSRAFGLLPRTLELLDLRGEADAFVERGLPWSLAPTGDLRNSLDYGRLDSPFPFMLILPQNITEELLESWAVKAGAEVLRGVRVTGLEQDGHGVKVSVEGGERGDVLRADFVVGCDGVHSTVRELLGIDFPGNAYQSSLVIADVRLSYPPDPVVWARTGPRGMVAVFPFGNDVFRLIVLDHDRMGAPADEPVTLDELRDSAGAILGADFGIHDPVWMSRFRSSQRQAGRYRVGRVLLAGDAAHTHIPSGGQGLQSGIQDAMNLGWKLAAEANGWAPAGVLDSYERERRPVASATLRKTDLAFRYEVSRSVGTRVLRRFSTQLMALGPLQVPVLHQFAGFAVRYPSMRGRSAHRLVGRRLPDSGLHVRGRYAGRLYELFRDRRFVLVDQTLDGRYATLAEAGWCDRVRVVRGRPVHGRRLPVAFLARPDGYLAWAAGRGATEPLESALFRWCGNAQS